MSKFKWEGLDEEIAAMQENFIMRKFWSDGTIAARQVEATKTLVFTPYAGFEYNLYDYPSKVTLVNLRNAPQQLVPLGPQVVGKDVVIGWCQPNHKSIKYMVDYYIDRITQVDMVINTNLNLMKMPFLIGVDGEDADRMKDIVTRILNDELVIFADLEDLNKVKSFATQTPYVIDRLVDYKRTLECELMTLLGVDNNGDSNLEKTHISADAVNANNDVINDFHQAIEEELNKWISEINRVFNREIKITSYIKPIKSIHEDKEVVDNGKDHE